MDKTCGFCEKPCGNDWCPTKDQEIKRLTELVQHNYKHWMASAKRSLEKSDEIKKLEKQLGITPERKFNKRLKRVGK